MAHWQYILWALGGPAGFAAACRYIPRAFLMLVGGLTTNPQRSKQCEKMIILSRGDAKELLERLAGSSEKNEPPATSAGKPAPAVATTPASPRPIPRRRRQVHP
jgi:hypothetical protein